MKNALKAASGLCLSLAWVLLSAGTGHAQDLQAQMRKAHGAAQPGKHPSDTARPNPEGHPHGPGSDAKGPHDEGHPHHLDAGLHHHEFGAGPGGAASGAAMDDAGVRHHRRSRALSPKQALRRNAEVSKLEQTYGSAMLHRPDAKAELSVHAWRIARLERMRELATQQNNTKLTERIDALINKENERHQRQLDRLRAAATDAGTLPTKGTP